MANTAMHMLDDFYIQMMILVLVCIASLFLIDVIIDPFKLKEE